MSVYNGEKYLSQAIESILNQTHSNFELIIVNDGSQDTSVAIIKKYMQQDHRIILIDRENKGLPYSLNEGISKAQGEYIARMDADDICLPERLTKQLDYLISNGLDVCGSYIKAFGESTNSQVVKYPITHNDIKFKLMFSPALAHPTVIFKKEVFNNIEYNVNYKVAQDYQLWVDIVNAGFRIGNLPEPLLQYRMHDSQASVDKVKTQSDTANKIREDFSKNLNKQERSIISRAIKSRTMTNSKEFLSLLKDTRSVGDKNKVSEDTIAIVLKELYNFATPKSPLLYLVYRNTSKGYHHNLVDEIKMFAKSVIPSDSNSLIFQKLKKIATKLHL